MNTLERLDDIERRVKDIPVDSKGFVWISRADHNALFETTGEIGVYDSKSQVFGWTPAQLANYIETARMMQLDPVTRAVVRKMQQS